MTNWKHELKPWVPPAVVQLYRRSRGDIRAAPPFHLPVRPLHQLVPNAESVTALIPGTLAARGDDWAVPAAELLTIATICAALRPQQIFEFGTYTGESTLVMAHNTPTDTRITTIDLDPNARDTHVHGLGVGGFRRFTVGAAFVATAAAAKIDQRYGDTRTFDYAPFRGQIDLIYIDADHTYEFAKADTASALTMLRPGGAILWDDYTWTDAHPECAGVTRTVNELAATRPIYRVAGTRFALYLDQQAQR